MRDPVPAADFSRVRTYPLAERENKVTVGQFARPVDSDGSLASFLDGLPAILAANSLRSLAASVVEARAVGTPVAFALGAHVIKVGLTPVFVGLMEDTTITSIAITGAGAIHDWEIAAIGATSEDVAAGLREGRFGMAEETGRELNEAAREAAQKEEGFGETLGRRISTSQLPHREKSLLAQAWENGVHVTVHVALGSDTVHQHPTADGAAIGAASLLDFRKLVTIVAGLSGGVWINCGSAVQLPEVFLKALSVAENLGFGVEGFTTADLDMIRHYRTEENVLRRPTRGDGKSFAITGHHEINIPLLAAAIGVERSRQIARTG